MPTQKQNKKKRQWRDNEENDCKEGYITIPKELGQ